MPQDTDAPSWDHDRVVATLALMYPITETSKRATFKTVFHPFRNYHQDYYDYVIVVYGKEGYITCSWDHYKKTRYRDTEEFLARIQELKPLVDSRLAKHRMAQLSIDEIYDMLEGEPL